MSTPRTAFVILAVLGSTAACHVIDPGSPVPVEGMPQDVSAVSGTWAGRYSSKDTGRHGAIRFMMPAQADTGFGEVEITFSPTLRLAEEAASPDGLKRTEEIDDPDPCTLLTITVVRIERDEVRGTIAPYWDPDCDCRAHTKFEGKVSGNRINGTFSTRRESSDRRILTGVWQVDRQD